MTTAASVPCDMCGQKLTTPESIARRMGPVCRRKLTPTAGHADAPAPAPRPVAGPGQTAIAYQPTLTEGAAA